jgi:hypothetical protein
MNDPLTEITFWAQVIGDAERTVYCPPEYESRIKCWVEARGMAGIIKVEASRMVPDGQIIVVDHNAIEASMRETMQREPLRLAVVPPYESPFAARLATMKASWRLSGGAF